ncbi:PREDICTED: stellacyanin-like [Camelina sativa]|uniref:Stellacyanin-like n=1 Tax=Camelina sativa TaxID=90675 RepID=A0ABM0XUX3_CAMSA|nr:PREDICTED: stellacyanin-like [Camelina sativa]
MEKSSTMLFLLNLCIISGIVVIRRCNATTYFVGDSSGWDISSDLESWTSGKRFSSGDVLMFQYSSTHSVYEVDKNNYQNCNSTDAIRTFTNGNTTVSLSKPGDRFFVCGNRLHCFSGMRLRVNVEGNAPSQSPVGSPQASAAGILQPSSKQNNPATGVASSATRFNGSGSSGSSMGIFVYLMVLAFPFIWSYCD